MSKIEYVDVSWNPVTGCSPVSEGCTHCYAKRMAQRLRGRFGYPQDDPFAVTLHPDKLDAPLHWAKPRRVFVCSMGDLFHEDVSESTLMRVFGVMSLCEREPDSHTFLVLTKRPERMRQFISKWWESPEHPRHRLTNLWLGVTGENQEQLDKRVRVLLEIPAAKHWVSIEPCLETVNIRDYLRGYGRFRTSTALDWVVLGGESGPGARPLHPDSARSVRDQCVAAGVPFFFKGWGGVHRAGWIHDGQLYDGRLLDGQLWDQYPA